MMMTSPAVQFWFDFASTYSYPSAMRIEEMARRYGCAVAWRPFVLGVIFHAQGWNDSPFNIYPAKGRYMWRDLERVCADSGLPFRRPSKFPRNGVAAARVACLAEPDWIGNFVRRVYAANFAADLDISEPKVLSDCLHGLIADPAALLEAAGGKDAKARLRRNTESAMELGIFGAPTFVVDNELFWGNDRLEAAMEWSRRVQR